MPKLSPKEANRLLNAVLSVKLNETGSRDTALAAVKQKLINLRTTPEFLSAMALDFYFVKFMVEARDLLLQERQTVLEKCQSGEVSFLELTAKILEAQGRLIQIKTSSYIDYLSARTYEGVPPKTPEEITRHLEKIAEAQNQHLLHELVASTDELRTTTLAQDINVTSDASEQVMLLMWDMLENPGETTEPDIDTLIKMRKMKGASGRWHSLNLSLSQCVEVAMEHYRQDNKLKGASLERLNELKQTWLGLESDAQLAEALCERFKEPTENGWALHALNSILVWWVTNHYGPDGLYGSQQTLYSQIPNLGMRDGKKGIRDACSGRSTLGVKSPGDTTAIDSVCEALRAEFSDALELNVDGDSEDGPFEAIPLGRPTDAPYAGDSLMCIAPDDDTDYSAPSMTSAGSPPG